MTKDWYDEGREQMMCEMAEEAGVSIEQALAVYSFLNEIGIVDYDIEKEVIWERYGEDDDNDPR